MTIIRRIFLVFSAFMMLVTLLMINTLWTVNNTVTNRDVVKSWLSESGFYENVIDEISTLIEDEIAKQEGSTDEDGLDTAMLVRVANDVFTPDSVQQKAEAVLDGVYDWLESDAQEILFLIDLEKEKDALATGLVDEVNTRLSSLPECDINQLNNLQGDVNIFTVACKPPGVDQQVNSFYEEFVNSGDFLPDSEFSSSEITVDVNGVEKTVAQAYASVPGWYGFARTTVWFVVIMGGIWSLLVLFLSKNIRYGVKHLMVLFIVATVFTLSSVMGAKLVVDTIRFEGGDSQTAETLVRPIIQQVVDSALAYGYAFSAIYATLALAAAIYLIVTKKKKDNEPDHKPKKDESAEAEPKAEPITTQSSDSKEPEPAKDSDTTEPKPTETPKTKPDLSAPKKPKK